MDIGKRTVGVGSARLSVDNGQNDEFGLYTLYARTGAKEYIVVTSGEKIIVIGRSNEKDAQTVYDTLLERIGK